MNYSIYKHTEIATIPDTWELVPIGNLITDIKGGASFKPSDFTNFGIKVISKRDINKTGWLKNNKDEQKYCSFEYAFANPRNQVDETYAIIVLRDLVPSGPNIGLIVQIKEADKYMLAQGVYGFRVNERTCSNYLVHVSNSDWYRKQINSIMVGSTQVHITNASLKKALVILPPIDEQKKIAEVLTDMDAYIESLEQLIAKKQSLRQGVTQELLTGKRRLPGFFEKWEEIKLGENAEFFKGKGLPKSSMEPSGLEPCIHYGELFTYYREIIQEIHNRTDDIKNSFRSVSNDVLMPTSDVTPYGLAKASCILTSGVILGGDILVIRPNSTKIYGPFLSYLIRHQERQILGLVNGITVYHIYASDMKKFTFWLPSIVEQKEIVRIIKDIDDNILTLNKEIEKVNQIKQGMMQELLTGRIRLQ